MPRHVQSILTKNFVFLTILALVATIGWGLLFAQRHSAYELKDHLRGQVSTLHQTQMELLNERTQREAAVGTLGKLWSEITALHQEVEGLKRTREQVQADLIRLRAEQEAASVSSGRS